MLIWLACAWMAGVVAAAYLPLGPTWLWGTTALGFGAAAVFRQTPLLRLALLCLAIAALGGLRYQAGIVVLGAGRIETLAERGELTIAGTVAEEPRHDGQSQRLVLRSEQALHAGRLHSVEGLILVVLPPYPAFRYGERLAVNGELERPRAAERPGEFDYRAYLAHRNIFSLMREAKGEVLGERSGNPALAALLDFREHCRRVLVRSLPEPQAALAVGVVLGIQAGIPAEIFAAFSITGTSHILVVSGWNFTIVAAVLAAITSRTGMGPWRAFALTLAAMWVYAIFTGASAAVLRAAAMASLAALAGASERQVEPWRLLLGACWAMSAIDPHMLWDLGFQLSALATGSLFAYATPIEQRISRWPVLGAPALGVVREAFTATMAAQLLTLPLILFQFGNLSIIAPLANIIIVPVVPYSMLFGVLALVGGLIWAPLGGWLGTLAWLPLVWISNGVMVLAKPAWAAMQLPPFPLWMLVGYYVVIGGLTIRSINRNRAAAKPELPKMYH
ncbi:MAG: ComEC family competence protein [Oscillochloris sp.]|nr:ComEC family competence protein [Oscillochloris sp.]